MKIWRERIPNGGRGQQVQGLVKRMSVSARATEKRPGPGAE